jgi:hypothetical protein
MPRSFAPPLVLFAFACTLSCAELAGERSALGLAACPEMNSNVDTLRTSFSADVRANGKVRAFVTAAKDVVAVAAHIEAEIADSCRRIGADIGMSPAEMAARNEPGGQASGACEALAARIDAIMRTGVQFSAQVTPPRCTANAQAEASCSGACNVEVTPAEIVARCEPARLSGYCQGRCSGQCDGRCSGQCNGQCSARDAQGNCAGTCSGQCYGTCDATCHARCEGQWQAPRCEGSVQGPSADAECNASCRAHANVNASCTPALVNVVANQNADIALRLVNSLRVHLPRLVYAEIALAKRLAGDVQVVGQVGAQLPRIIGQAGAHALTCVAAAADASATASARINVSVRASASVTGRVGASSG